MGAHFRTAREWTCFRLTPMQVLLRFLIFKIGMKGKEGVTEKVTIRKGVQKEPKKRIAGENPPKLGPSALNKYIHSSPPIAFQKSPPPPKKNPCQFCTMKSQG